MAEDGKEMIASMGDDTPAAVLSNDLPPAVAFLPAELQPGHQPADRQPARRPGDEPEDPLRQPEATCWTKTAARPRFWCWKARSSPMRNSR